MSDTKNVSFSQEEEEDDVSSSSASDGSDDEASASDSGSSSDDDAPAPKFKSRNITTKKIHTLNHGDSSSSSEDDGEFIFASKKRTHEQISAPQRGLRDRTKLRQTVRREDVIHIHDLARHLRTPYDTDPIATTTSLVTTRNYMASLRRLSRLSHVQLMHRLCVFRVVCALHEDYYTLGKLLITRDDAPDELCDDIVLFSTFILYTDHLLKRLIVKIGSSSGHGTTLEQRNFFELCKTDLTTAFRLKIIKAFIKQKPCAVNKTAPRKVSARLLQFTSLALPTIEALVGQSVDDARFKPFYTDAELADLAPDSAQRMAHTYVRAVDCDCYVDQSYQGPFVGYFLLARFPALVSGDALRLFEKNLPPALTAPGAPLSQAIAAFLGTYPDWWATWAAMFDTCIHSLLNFARIEMTGRCQLTTFVQTLYETGVAVANGELVVA